jgi:hypothetical protein
MLSPISRNPGVMQMLAFLTPIAFVGWMSCSQEIQRNVVLFQHDFPALQWFATERVTSIRGCLSSEYRIKR